MATQINNCAIDISHWTGNIDWEKLKKFDNGAIQVVITKATDSWNGKMFTDSKLIQNLKGAKSVDMPIAVYHWLQDDVAPTLAVDYLLDVVNNYNIAYYNLDIEERDIKSPTDYAWRAQVWLERIEKLTKKRPKIYTAEWYMNGYLRTPLKNAGKDPKKILGWMSSYPLWVAQYTKRQPRIPQEWEKYQMWQYSANVWYPYYGVSQWANKYYGNGWDIFGVNGSKSFDANVFHCSLEELIGEDAIPPIPPEPPIDCSEFKKELIETQRRLDICTEKIDEIKRIVGCQ